MHSWRFRFIVLSLLTVGACSSDRVGGPDSSIPARAPGAPQGWLFGTGNGVFTLGLDKTQKHGGTSAAFISTTTPNPTTFGVLTQGLNADRYRGRRVRFTGWVKPTSVTGAGGALWFRVDGPGTIMAFDNMSGRPILGTSDWREVSVVLDVPPNAIGFGFGVLLAGSGDLIVDDLRLEVVGTEVPTTDLLTGPQPSSDSATIAGTYARLPFQPSNLDFEGVPTTVFPGTSAWISSNAVAVRTAQPGDDDSDLEPLRGMVGSARIVALGEGTHGTREFFQMKHRVFQFLVRQMGFTHFAIEATWPESNDLNQYVLTGQGNPERLLSNLYFWTWNTREVLDLIEWMRAWNQTAPADRKVQFVGFDMQAPGAAMDTVRAFIQRVDAGKTSVVDQRFTCIRPYRNQGVFPGRPLPEYAALASATKDSCRASLQSIYDLIAGERSAYQAASSPAKYENVLRSARLVQQFEEMASAYASASLGSLARDRFMAENAQWLLDQGVPGTRMMIWAHNYHVSRLPGAMGNWLGRAYGASYVNLGFLFGRGRFNAVGPTGGGSRPWSAQQVLDASLESLFLETGKPRLLLDARRVAAGGEAAAPLRGPIAMRSIGAVFDPNSEFSYFASYVFPLDFDLLMFVSDTNESTLLPFVF